MFSTRNKTIDNSEGIYETTIIAKDLKIVGNIESLKNIRLDGQIEGNIHCQGKLIIGKTGQLVGEITTQDAEIYGYVQGKITVLNTLTLKKGADIQGEMFAKNIVSEIGAKFNVICKMDESKNMSDKNDKMITDDLNFEESTFNSH